MQRTNRDPRLKEFKKRLKSMQKELEEKLPYLNCGGCIHFAYFFSKKLKSFGIEHEVILEVPTERLEYMDYHTYEGFSAVPHVFLHIKGFGSFDGFRAIKKEKQFYSYITNTLNLNRLRKEYEWNSDYLSLHTNQELGRIINKHFNDYRRA